MSAPSGADTHLVSAITCPTCRASIAQDDVNVKENVAFCRGCSALMKASDLTAPAEVGNVDPADPPPGCTFSSDGITTTITASVRSMLGAVGALVVAVFWNSIVSVFVFLAFASTLQHVLGTIPAWFPAPPLGKGNSGIPLGMTLFLWVFLTPFILVGLYMICCVFLSIAGRIEVRLRGDEVTVFTGCGPIGWRRRVDARQVKSVGLGWTTWKENDEAKPVVVIECDRTVRIGSMLTKPRREWVAAVLKQILGV